MTLFCLILNVQPQCTKTNFNRLMLLIILLHLYLVGNSSAVLLSLRTPVNIAKSTGQWEEKHPFDILIMLFR
jgi:hypothetical protein